MRSAGASARPKKVFDDVQCTNCDIPSSWRLLKSQKAKTTAFVQTPESIYDHQDMETQSGRFTKVIDVQVSKKDEGMAVGEILHQANSREDMQIWTERIADGFVTVDYEVVTDASIPVSADSVVQFVGHKANNSTQTRSNAMDEESAAILSSKPSLNEFLRRILPSVECLLDHNVQSTASVLVDKLGAGLDEEDSSAILYWRQLSVDLEKRKVVYPDWTKARHVSGVITKSHVTRNQERIYDVEYDDGTVISGIKEEYIRLLDDPNDDHGAGKGLTRRSSQGSSSAAQALAGRLKEGVRVFAKVMTKNGAIKYLPGRVVKVGRNTYDVECEGNRLETNLGLNDLCIGLSDGQRVEARKPSTTLLHATAVSWNCTGNLTAVAFGRLDIIGWCNQPGAVCIWNAFSSRPDQSAEPSHVLDHSSCILACAFHPTVPSIVVGGSFNGEIVAWDLVNADQVLAVSPVIEYTHRDAVVQLHWVLDQGDPQLINNWSIVSVSADGRVLVWSLRNKLQFPLKGFSLSRNVNPSSRFGGPGAGKTDRAKAGGRHLPISHGATTSAVSSSGGSSVSRPTWIVLGQEGGGLLRLQFSRFFSSTDRLLTAEFLRTLPPADEVFPSFKSLLGGVEEGALQLPQAHIGGVTSIDWSPFHRHIYLTAGSDGQIRLFHTLQSQCLLRLEPAAMSPYHHPAVDQDVSGGIGAGRRGHQGEGGRSLGMVSVTAVRFSPVRPSVFAAATSDGRIFLYDLYSALSGSDATINLRSVQPAHVMYVTQNMTLDSAGHNTIDVSQRRKTKQNDLEPVSVSCLAFNSKRKDILSAGDWLGRLHVWKLPARMTTRHSDETSKWTRIGRITDEGDSSEQAKD